MPMDRRSTRSGVVSSPLATRSRRSSTAAKTEQSLVQSIQNSKPVNEIAPTENVMEIEVTAEVHAEQESGVSSLQPSQDETNIPNIPDSVENSEHISTDQEETLVDKEEVNTESADEGIEMTDKTIADKIVAAEINDDSDGDMTEVEVMLPPTDSNKSMDVDCNTEKNGEDTHPPMETLDTTEGDKCADKRDSQGIVTNEQREETNTLSANSLARADPVEIKKDPLRFGKVEELSKQDMYNLCHVCGKGYLSHVDLQTHMKREHNNMVQYRCMLCQMVYLNKEKALSHSIAEHKDDEGIYIRPNTELPMHKKNTETYISARPKKRGREYIGDEFFPYTLEENEVPVKVEMEAKRKRLLGGDSGSNNNHKSVLEASVIPAHDDDRPYRFVGKTYESKKKSGQTMVISPAHILQSKRTRAQTTGKNQLLQAMRPSKPISPVEVTESGDDGVILEEGKAAVNTELSAAEPSPEGSGDHAANEPNETDSNTETTEVADKTGDKNTEELPAKESTDKSTEKIMDVQGSEEPMDVTTEKTAAENVDVAESDENAEAQAKETADQVNTVTSDETGDQPTATTVDQAAATTDNTSDQPTATRNETSDQPTGITGDEAAATTENTSEPAPVTTENTTSQTATTDKTNEQTATTTDTSSDQSNITDDTRGGSVQQKTGEAGAASVVNPETTTEPTPNQNQESEKDNTTLEAKNPLPVSGAVVVTGSAVVRWPDDPDIPVSTWQEQALSDSDGEDRLPGFSSRNHKNVIWKYAIKVVGPKVKKPEIQCRLCAYCCPTKDSFYSHIALNHKTIVPWRCEHCDYATRWVTSLRVHLKKKHPDTLMETCQCGMKFKTMAELNKHAEVHAPVTCPVCKKRCANKQSFDAHYTETHVRHKVRYACPVCQEKYDSKQECIEHMDTHRRQEQIDTSVPSHIPCPVCSEEFPTLMRLATHMKTHGVLKYCTECKQSFETMESFDLHMATHTGTSKGSVTCSVCGLHFKTIQELIRHTENEHAEKRQEQSYSCVKCQKTYEDKKSFQAHITSSHKEDIMFRCSLCPNILFKSLSTAQQHYTEKHGKSSQTNKQAAAPAPAPTSLFAKSASTAQQAAPQPPAAPTQTLYRCAECQKCYKTAQLCIAHQKIHNIPLRYQSTGGKLGLTQQQEDQVIPSALRTALLAPRAQPQSYSLLTGNKTPIVDQTKAANPSNLVQIFMCERCHSYFPNANSLAMHVLQMHSNVQTSQANRVVSSNSRIMQTAPLASTSRQEIRQEIQQQTTMSQSSLLSSSSSSSSSRLPAILSRSSRQPQSRAQLELQARLQLQAQQQAQLQAQAQQQAQLQAQQSQHQQQYIVDDQGNLVPLQQSDQHLTSQGQYVYYDNQSVVASAEGNNAAMALQGEGDYAAQSGQQVTDPNNPEQNQWQVNQQDLSNYLLPDNQAQGEQEVEWVVENIDDPTTSTEQQGEYYTTSTTEYYANGEQGGGEYVTTETGTEYYTDDTGAMEGTAVEQQQQYYDENTEQQNVAGEQDFGALKQEQQQQYHIEGESVKVEGLQNYGVETKTEQMENLAENSNEFGFRIDNVVGQADQYEQCKTENTGVPEQYGTSVQADQQVQQMLQEAITAQGLQDLVQVNVAPKAVGNQGQGEVTSQTDALPMPTGPQFASSEMPLEASGAGIETSVASHMEGTGEQISHPQQLQELPPTTSDQMPLPQGDALTNDMFVEGSHQQQAEMMNTDQGAPVHQEGADEQSTMPQTVNAALELQQNSDASAIEQGVSQFEPQSNEGAEMPPQTDAADISQEADGPGMLTEGGAEFGQSESENIPENVEMQQEQNEAQTSHLQQDFQPEDINVPAADSAPMEEDVMNEFANNDAAVTHSNTVEFQPQPQSQPQSEDILEQAAAAIDEGLQEFQEQLFASQPQEQPDQQLQWPSETLQQLQTSGEDTNQGSQEIAFQPSVEASQDQEQMQWPSEAQQQTSAEEGSQEIAFQPSAEAIHEQEQQQLQWPSETLQETNEGEGSQEIEFQPSSEAIQEQQEQQLQWPSEDMQQQETNEGEGFQPSEEDIQAHHQMEGDPGMVPSDTTGQGEEEQGGEDQVVMQVEIPAGHELIMVDDQLDPAILEHAVSQINGPNGELYLVVPENLYYSAPDNT